MLCPGIQNLRTRKTDCEPELKENLSFRARFVELAIAVNSDDASFHLKHSLCVCKALAGAFPASYFFFQVSPCWKLDLWLAWGIRWVNWWATRSGAWCRGLSCKWTSESFCFSWLRHRVCAWVLQPWRSYVAPGCGLWPSSFSLTHCYCLCNSRSRRLTLVARCNLSSRRCLFPTQF